MSELADEADSKSAAEKRGSSSLPTRTKCLYRLSGLRHRSSKPAISVRVAVGAPVNNSEMTSQEVASLVKSEVSYTLSFRFVIL